MQSLLETHVDKQAQLTHSFWRGITAMHSETSKPEACSTLELRPIQACGICQFLILSQVLRAQRFGDGVLLGQPAAEVD